MKDEALAQGYVGFVVFGYHVGPLWRNADIAYASLGGSVLGDGCYARPHTLPWYRGEKGKTGDGRHRRWGTAPHKPHYTGVLAESLSPAARLYLQCAHTPV